MHLNPQISKQIDLLKNDRTRGASELARQAAGILKIAAETAQTDDIADFLLEMREVGRQLIASHPSMAPLLNIVTEILNELEGKDTEFNVTPVKSLIITRTAELAERSLQSVARIATHASELIVSGDRLFTHSYSSTVIRVMEKAFFNGSSFEVIVTRSGAGRTGEKTAIQLAMKGIPVTFIDDTAAGLLITEASKVIVGADRICADGALVNGAGTYLIALAAKARGIPFYVFCEQLKFDPRLRGTEVNLEEKETTEVVPDRTLPPQVTLRNPYFDVTPLELITGVVTENGLLLQDEVIFTLQRLSAQLG